MSDSPQFFRWFLFVLTFILYSNTLTHDFAWDDKIVINENPYVKSGISGIPQTFVKHNSDYRADKYGYRPITLTSFCLEYSLIGEKPFFYHLTNVLLYSILGVLIFNFLLVIVPNQSLFHALAITLLFIVHPSHTEVVANIKSRDEILCLIFGVIAFKMFHRFLIDGTVKYGFWTIICLWLSVLSKESGAMLIPVFIVFSGIKSGGYDWRLTTKSLRVVFFMGVIVVCTLWIGTLGKDEMPTSAGAGIFHESGILGNSFFYESRLLYKLLNSFVLLWHYLVNFLLPYRQLYYYGFNQIPAASISSPIVWLSIILNCLIFLMAIKSLKNGTLVGLGIVFFYITLAVYLHLLKPLADTLADRFLFMPSLGGSIALGTLFHNWMSKNGYPFELNAKSLSSNKTRLIFIFFCLIFFAGIVKSFTRNKVWKNDLLLSEGDMPYLDNCARAHAYYAQNLQAKLNAGFNSEIEKNMIEHYQRAIALHRESYYAWISLGSYLTNHDRIEEGMRLLDSAIAIFPNQADPHYYMGEALLKINRLKEAIAHLKISMKLANKVLMTYSSLALAYSGNKQFEEALEINNSALNQFGASFETLNVLGVIYFQMGALEKSIDILLQLSQYGLDKETIYKTAIGRCQVLKNDSLASVLFQRARAEGLFKNY